MTKSGVRFRSVLSWVLASLIVTVTLFTGAPRAKAAGTWISGTTTAGGSSRSWKLYVPSGYQAGNPLPLIEMLHGCTQDDAQFDAGTQMSTLAEPANFLVVYPIQPSSVDQNKCWEWWVSGDQSRGSGEPLILKTVVDDVAASYSVNRSKVYVAGMSAGAAMTAVMAATYPDVYAAAGVHSGLEYKAAVGTSDSDTTSAWNAMRTGGPDPKTQGRAAYQASGSAARVVPTIVFQGKSDYTVYPVNGDQALSQAMWMDDWADDGQNNSSIDDTADQTTTGQAPNSGYTYTKYIYNDSKGSEVGEKWLVDSMGHAWSGGSTNGTYTDPKGPSASQNMWSFFQRFSLTTCSVTVSPAPGTYNNYVDVTLTGTPSTCSLYYTTDGSTPTTGSPRYSAPFRLNNTATVKVLPVDAGGKQNPVVSFAYTINHTGPVIQASPAAGTYGGSLSVALSADLSGTIIYYTTDGTTPTTSSPQYSGPVSVTASKTIKAMGVSGGTQGSVYTFAYTITGIAITNSPAGGTYSGPTSVTLSMNMPGNIYYTTDGSTPTTGSPKYTAPIQLSCTSCPQTYTLKWLGQDGAGNTGGAGSATYTINNPPTTYTVNFYSTATEDGYMFQNGASVANSSLIYLEMGDLGLNTGEGSVVSFDTSSLPDGATIKSATLSLYRYGNTYFNANGFGPIMADIKSGCFNSNCAVENADWAAASSYQAAVTIINIPISDLQPATGDLAAGSLAYVNKTGKTQFRVRFQNATNSNYSLDALRFYAGETTTQSLKPVLVVTYQ